VLIAAVAVGFPLVAFLLGWSVLGPVRDFDRAERFTAAWGAGYAVLAAAQFLAFVTAAPQPWAQLAVAGLVLAVALLVRRRHPGRLVPAADVGPLAAGWALGYAHLLGAQALLPQYVGSEWWGDWCWHYRLCQVFLGRLDVDVHWIGAGTYTLASRTPLFNLAAAFPMAVAGDGFAVFQVADAALNSCWIPAVYLVLRDLFGVRAARLGLVLAPLNLWLLHNAWFTWPKMLAAYYLVLALHFYLRWLRQREAGPWLPGCWISGLLGFLTHQVAAVYLGALVLHAVVALDRRGAARLRDLVLLPAAALVLLGPWYAWVCARFGLGTALASTPVTQMEMDRPWVISHVGVPVFNLVASVVPVELGRELLVPPLTWASVYRGLTGFYLSMVPGALTASLCVFLLTVPVRQPPNRPRQPGWGAVWAFVLVGALGALVLHPRSYWFGIAHAAQFPSVVVLAALAWGRLSRAPRTWAALTGAGMALEFALLFWSHVVLSAWPDLLDPVGGNALLKAEYRLRFLADELAPQRPAVVAATLAVELVLVVLLVRWFRHPERLQNDGGRV
jgi:hypothetical protein